MAKETNLSLCPLLDLYWAFQEMVLHKGIPYSVDRRILGRTRGLWSAISIALCISLASISKAPSISPWYP